MMRRLLLTLLLLLPLHGFAAIDAYHFDDPAKEARFKLLIEELRCLVCQNQNLADSNAELAQDMRKLTYEMVQRGASTEEVVTYMVQRYGDFVMYRPPVQSNTLMLWVGPFIILGIGLVILIGFVRRRARAPAETISQDELARAEQLLSKNKDDKE
ncbi:MAG: cytochrome c-type biogenesis protein [Sedimenticola sp.]